MGLIVAEDELIVRRRRPKFHPIGCGIFLLLGHLAVSRLQIHQPWIYTLPAIVLLTFLVWRWTREREWFLKLSPARKLTIVTGRSVFGDEREVITVDVGNIARTIALEYEVDFAVDDFEDHYHKGQRLGLVLQPPQQFVFIELLRATAAEVNSEWAASRWFATYDPASECLLIKWDEDYEPSLTTLLRRIGAPHTAEKMSADFSDLKCKSEEEIQTLIARSWALGSGAPVPFILMRELGLTLEEAIRRTREAVGIT